MVMVKRKRLRLSSATARVNKAKGWIEHDVTAVWPNGEWERERQMCPRQTIGAARDFARARLQAMLDAGPPSTRRSFESIVWDKYIGEFRRLHFAGGPRGALKPSQVSSIESHWENHIRPFWGSLTLDKTTPVAIAEWVSELQRPVMIRGEKGMRKPKTINNILITFNTMLARAEEWGYAPAGLPRARTLRLARPEIDFYTEESYAMLLEGARRCGADVELAVLLGARAGLRAGEIVGLRADDVGETKNELLVQRSIWNVNVHLPKSGKPRRVPIGAELADRLRSSASGYVLSNDDGSPLTGRQLQHLVKRAERAAGLPDPGGRVHKLRHTYASHLVMRGVAIVVVKELLGHSDIQTTMRYAHLAPTALEAAVLALDGDRAETTLETKKIAGKVG